MNLFLRGAVNCAARHVADQISRACVFAERSRRIWAATEARALGHGGLAVALTSRSVRTLAGALERLGHHVSHTFIAELLHDLGYSLRANVKTREGAQHPDRDAQFRYIRLVGVRCTFLLL